jgi:hypothetical protein
METMLVNLVIGLAVLLFCAMAIFPMLLADKPARRTPIQADDDQVIGIQPLPPVSHGPRLVAATDPDHRHAA